MKLSDFDDAELGAMVRDRFTRLAQAHDAGLSNEHPRDTWNRDNETLRKYRAAAAGAAVEGEIQKPALDSVIKGYSRLADPGRRLAATQPRTDAARTATMANHVKGYRRLA